MFDESYANNERARVVQKQNFEEMEATSEYMETHYYKRTELASENLVKLN